MCFPLEQPWNSLSFVCCSAVHWKPTHQRWKQLSKYGSNCCKNSNYNQLLGCQFKVQVTVPLWTCKVDPFCDWAVQMRSPPLPKLTVSNSSNLKSWDWEKVLHQGSSTTHPVSHNNNKNTPQNMESDYHLHGSKDIEHNDAGEISRHYFAAKSVLEWAWWYFCFVLLIHII